MTSLLKKALDYVVGGSTGTLSDYVIGAPPQYGQPLPRTIADVSGLITPERQRELALKSPTVAGCLNAIIDYSVSVPLKIRNVDPAKPADSDRVNFLKQFLAKPNNNDTESHFKQKIFRDMITLGAGTAEIEWNFSDRPFALHTLDAARIRIDFDEHGNNLGYDMLDAKGQPITRADGIHAWEPRDVIYFPLNVSSDTLYASSKMSQVFALGYIESLMLDFISRRFTETNVPYGIYDLGDVSDNELQRAIEKWNEQALSPHQIMITGSKTGSKFTAFSYKLSELDAKNLLLDIQAKIMGIIGVTKNEFGDSQDVNKSNGYNLSFTFKKRAIEPVLNEFCDTLTRRFFWESFGFTDLELYYQEIDSRDALLQAQIDDVYLKAGVMSVNEIRNRRGDVSIEGGDEPLIMMSTGAIPLSLVAQFAEAQLQGILAMVQVEQSGAATGGIQSPITRAPQSPLRYTTPDASGSSSPKFKYPTEKPQSNTPQKPRGAVQKLRSTGLRTENNQGK